MLQVLHRMGYSQVLYRSWGSLTATCITISAMSVLTSISGERSVRARVRNAVPAASRLPGRQPAHTARLLSAARTTASFATGLSYGGPVVCIWGWIGVSALMLCIGLGMAELTSAYPTSGGMYCE